MAKRSNGFADGWEVVIWCLLGLVTGTALMVTFLRSAGYARGEGVPTDVGVVGLVLLFGTMLLFTVIGYQLWKEVARERITVARYWTTFFGIAVAVFTLLGLSGVDELLVLWRG